MIQDPLTAVNRQRLKAARLNNSASVSVFPAALCCFSSLSEMTKQFLTCIVPLSYSMLTRVVTAHSFKYNNKKETETLLPWSADTAATQLRFVS